MTLRRWALVALALPLVLSGCVLTPDEEASPLGSVPEDLLSPTTSAATTTTTAPVASPFALDLFWHINQGEGQRALVKVTRLRESEADPQTALEVLIAGPSEDEVTLFAPLGNLLPLVDPLLAPTLSVAEDGTATVTISDEFELRENDASKIPVAEELVCTLTTFESVVGVVIADSAGPIPLTNRAAETITGRAERDDYGCDETLELKDEEDIEQETTTTTAAQSTTTQATVDGGF